MLNDDILELRRKLNESVTNDKDYRKTHKISIELDELIAKYYKKRLSQTKEICKKN